MNEVITAVYEIMAEDPAARAVLVAVEQSHELPTDLAPDNAVRDSLAHVRTVVERPGWTVRRDGATETLIHERGDA